MRGRRRMMCHSRIELAPRRAGNADPLASVVSATGDEEKNGTSEMTKADACTPGWGRKGLSGIRQIIGRREATTHLCTHPFSRSAGRDVSIRLCGRLGHRYLLRIGNCAMDGDAIIQTAIARARRPLAPRLGPIGQSQWRSPRALFSSIALQACESISSSRALREAIRLCDDILDVRALHLWRKFLALAMVELRSNPCILYSGAVVHSDDVYQWS